MIDQGLPSFYITINLVDTLNPLVRFLTGDEIDIDHLLPDYVFDHLHQKYLVMKNLFLAARFFNIYMEAFIDVVLGMDSGDPDIEREGSALGKVKAYYGCVEAQGRGTGHCHMLVWLEGSLNPNEIKDQILQSGDQEFCERLLSFLDDTILTSIPKPSQTPTEFPSSHSHPSTIHGIQDLYKDEEVN